MGGVSEDIQHAILEETNYVQGEFPFKYLGVPLNEGRLNKEMFADLLNKIQKALHHWANYKLSYAGNISLINTEFLWGTVEGQRKLIMKSWTSCCKPHIEGGFNIKEILAWNKCILCKWIWAIENHSDSSWVKSFHSESWKSILRIRDPLLEKTGSRDNARTLLSSFVTGGKLKLSLIYEQLREHDRRLSWVKAVWNRVSLPKHSMLVVLAMQHKLATIDKLNHKGLHMVNRCTLCKAANESHQHLFFKCPFATQIWHRLLQWMKLRGRTDSLSRELYWLAGRRIRRHWKVQWDSYQQNIWTTDKGREYYIAKGYDFIRSKGEHVQWQSLVWNKYTAPKHGFLAWIYFHNALNTKAKLHNLGISEDDTCAICGNGSETASHLFFECEYSSRVISLIGDLIGEAIPPDAPTDWRRKLNGSGIRKGIINALLNVCIYCIWRQRNLCKHELTLLNPAKVVNLIIKEVTRRTLNFPELVGVRDRDLIERMINCS
ncbi:uncharacterized protein LOC141588530 [Silene latifolia]|uniref:uncharacterized protein LOC141588530 n=1 Tax=Silene latifolia TaxID=37657 RepID=UPI003D783C12